jgi:hypothetical protein
VKTFNGQGYIDFDAPAQAVSKQSQDAACQAAGRRARQQMESLAEMKKVLRRLRTGVPLEKMEYDISGGRVAAIVHVLRDSYGFVFDGHGTKSNPYVMRDPLQVPALAGVTDEMKAAYYQLPQWIELRQLRFQCDGYTCVLCRSGDDLQCHHVTYERLFNELLQDLMTVCCSCHETIHQACKLKFPGGISSQYAYQIGWKGPEAWLLP